MHGWIRRLLYSSSETASEVLPQNCVRTVEYGCFFIIRSQECHTGINITNPVSVVRDIFIPYRDGVLCYSAAKRRKTIIE